MAKKTHVVDSFDNALFQQFNRDLVGDEMAHDLSKITMNWAKLEQALYLSMKSIDARRADSWREAFFSQPNLSVQKEKARKSIRAILASSYPELQTFFEETLDLLQDVQRRRNAVSHGLWLPIEEANRYPVQPLRYNKAKAIFEPVIIVDLEFLNSLLDDMSKISQRIYWVGTELLAHQ